VGGNPVLLIICVASTLLSVEDLTSLQVFGLGSPLQLLSLLRSKFRVSNEDSAHHQPAGGGSKENSAEKASRIASKSGERHAVMQQLQSERGADTAGHKDVDDAGAAIVRTENDARHAVARAESCALGVRALRVWSDYMRCVAESGGLPSDPQDSIKAKDNLIAFVQDLEELVQDLGEVGTGPKGLDNNPRSRSGSNALETTAVQDARRAVEAVTHLSGEIYTLLLQFSHFRPDAVGAETEDTVCSPAQELLEAQLGLEESFPQRETAADADQAGGDQQEVQAYVTETVQELVSAFSRLLLRWDALHTPLPALTWVLHQLCALWSRVAKCLGMNAACGERDAAERVGASGVDSLPVSLLHRCEDSAALRALRGKLTKVASSVVMKAYLTYFSLSQRTTAGPRIAGSVVTAGSAALDRLRVEYLHGGGGRHANRELELLDLVVAMSDVGVKKEK
jgi:hypothetical protein